MSIAMRRGVGAITSSGSGAGSGFYIPLKYTGNGSTQSITGTGFQPDMVWIKNRDAADFHLLTDVDRGATKYFQISQSPTETTDVNSLTSFDLDGFSVGTTNEINTNTENYMAWCFKKEVEVFDIKLYTGTSSAHTETHNLSIIPEMIIVRARTSATDDLHVYHKDNSATTPENLELKLNNTGAATNQLTWNNTAPTSSVFTVNQNVNNGGTTYVAYLFASKIGVSKVGSYIGTGSSGNTITGLGFNPRFLMIKKKSSGTGNWNIFDSARGNNLSLKANTTGIESTLNVTLDAGGFTLNNIDTDTNGSGSIYVYLAIT